MHKIFFLLVSSTLLFNSCSSSRGFSRGALRQQVTERREISDAEIESTLALKPQLPKTFKLGIYFKDPDPVMNRYYPNHHTWNWTKENKDQFLSLHRDLVDQKQISEVILISSSTVASTDLKSLRLAAAQHGADALLVVSGATQLDRYNNEWGLTYIALVTAFFVPGTELDVLFLTQATMWDVRNQYLYLTAEAESIKKQTKPAAFIDEKAALRRSKDESLAILKAEVIKLLNKSQN